MLLFFFYYHSFFFFSFCLFFFFFNDTAPTEIYTLSLHDALPSSRRHDRPRAAHRQRPRQELRPGARSEEHTSELQSQSNLVCRLLLEKKKKHLVNINIKSLKQRDTE